MARLIARNKKYVKGCEIREYEDNNENRYFTASIFEWKGFKFFSEGKSSSDMLNNYVIPKVKEIRDKMEGKSNSEQWAIIDDYPEIYHF